jgi:ABC-type multidrug transport system fused ATPase/permease subunit
MVLIKPYMKQQVVGFFLTLLFSLAAMVLPLISSWMIDEIAVPSAEIPAGVDDEGRIAFSLAAHGAEPEDVWAYENADGTIVVVFGGNMRELPARVDANGNLVVTPENRPWTGEIPAYENPDGNIVISVGNVKEVDVSASVEGDALEVALGSGNPKALNVVASVNADGNILVRTSEPNFDLLLFGILFFVGAALTQPVVGILRDVLFMRVTEKVTRNMRNTMFSKMLFSNFKFLNKLKGGDLISIITNDGRSASDFISVIFISILSSVVMLICIVVGMLMQSYELTLIVMGVFGVYFLFNVFYTKRLQKMSLDVQENYDSLCTSIDQTNNAILSTKAYNQEKNAETRFQAITDKMYKDNCRIGFNEIVLDYLANAITMICLGILYGGGILFVMNGTMTLGQVFALGQFFMMLNDPVSALLGVSVNANIIMPVFERIEGYTELETEDVGEYEGILRFPHITIRDLSFSYSDENENEGNYALKNVAMQLPARGLVNIIGESGSGKTTFTKLMLGLYPVQRGMIHYGNRDINDISIATLRGNIGYVPQESEILNDSVFNNISFGDQDVWLDEAMEVCTMLRLHEKIMSLPSNYRSVISERVNLSGGEKQRILIARAILKEAPIIIMDEPLSALDSENSELVSRIIMRLAEEKLVLMITHYECKTLRPVMKVVFNRGEAKVWKDSGIFPKRW